MVPCSHWWQSHWSLGLPGAEVGAVMWAALGGELHTDTGCLACHPRSASAGTRRSSTQTWWPPAHGSAASPGRAQTHGQQPGVGPCLRGMWRTVTDSASSSPPHLLQTVWFRFALFSNPVQLSHSCSWKAALCLPLTHVVSKGPWLIIIKVDVTLTVCFWEEGVSKNPTWAIKGEVVSMPIPAGA